MSIVAAILERGKWSRSCKWLIPGKLWETEVQRVNVKANHMPAIYTHTPGGENTANRGLSIVHNNICTKFCYEKSLLPNYGFFKKK